MGFSPGCDMRSKAFFLAKIIITVAGKNMRNSKPQNQPPITSPKWS